MPKSLLLTLTAVLVLTTTVRAQIEPSTKGHALLTTGIMLGPVFPFGSLGDGYSTGFGAKIYAGVIANDLALRLIVGSAEPDTRDETNDMWSDRVGRPVKTKTAIVPVELQALYRIPLGESQFAFEAYAGGGASNVTIRIDGSDGKLADEWDFSFGGGAGISYFWRIKIGIHSTFSRVLTDDTIDYVTTDLELAVEF